MTDVGLHTDMVEKTWEELGFKLRALGYKTIVRTLPHLRKTPGGVLWLPPKLQGFHGELPHLVEVRAVVLSAGPLGLAKNMEVGSIIMFKRLHFGFWYRVGDLVDQEYVGWVDANDVIGYDDGYMDWQTGQPAAAE